MNALFNHYYQSNKFSFSDLTNNSEQFYLIYYLNISKPNHTASINRNTQNNNTIPWNVRILDEFPNGNVITSVVNTFSSSKEKEKYYFT